MSSRASDEGLRAKELAKSSARPLMNGLKHAAANVRTTIAINGIPLKQRRAGVVEGRSARSP